MAKAIAVCTCETCGKTFEVSEFKRNRREADDWKDWAERTYDECPDCYRKRLDDEREERAESAGLPTLSGSPKQIAWAEKIRDDIWQKYLRFEAEADRSLVQAGDKPEDRAFFQIGCARCRKVFQKITEAKEYIDGRDEFYQSFIQSRLEPMENDGK